ncbi:MAG: hypothetical protein HQL51_09370 [Magnetococcales bacterium]|nr:hypothetical protein [Magnetococcales bacterium]
MNHPLPLSALALGAMLGGATWLDAFPAQAGRWSGPEAENYSVPIVPRVNPVHPVDYWWWYNPSRKGKWDYYAQYPYGYENAPVPVTTYHQLVVRPRPFTQGGYADSPAFTQQPVFIKKQGVEYRP